MSLFKGSGVALVTPFLENGEVDFKSLKKLIEFQIENNTDSIIICGTTGEAPTLSCDEHLKVIEKCIEYVNKRIPVIAGTGSNCTNSAITMSKKAMELGADGLLLVTPYYNKTTQEGLVNHYSKIADSVSIPVILYNVPSRTGCNLEANTVLKIVNNSSNVVGIKEASGSVLKALEIKNLLKNRIDIYSGCDDIVEPILAAGGIGVISVVANIMPKYMHDMVFKYLDGDVNKSLDMQLNILKMCKCLFSEVNPIPIKKALETMNLCKGYLREPLIEMSEENSKILIKEMKKFNLT